MKPADEVLREVLAERADGITPDGDVYGAVLARRRRGRRRAVIGAGVAAAVVVGGAAAAVPAVRGADRSLPAVTPSPTADPLTACVPGSCRERSRHRRRCPLPNSRGNMTSAARSPAIGRSPTPPWSPAGRASS